MNRQLAWTTEWHLPEETRFVMSSRVRVDWAVLLQRTSGSHGRRIAAAFAGDPRPWMTRNTMRT